MSCNETYTQLSLNQTDNQFIVLGGTSRDIQVEFRGTSEAKLANVTSIVWHVELPAGQTWSRIAGKFWNEQGQAGAEQLITMGSDPQGWIQTKDLTLSAVYVRTSQPLPDGLYTGTILVVYRCYFGDGSYCDGTKSVGLKMKVFKGRRLQPIEISEATDPNAYQTIDEPWCAPDDEYYALEQDGGNFRYTVKVAPVGSTDRSLGSPASSDSQYQFRALRVAASNLVVQGISWEGVVITDQILIGDLYAGGGVFPQPFQYYGDFYRDATGAYTGSVVLWSDLGYQNYPTHLYRLDAWEVTASLTLTEVEELFTWPCLPEATPLGIEGANDCSGIFDYNFEDLIVLKDTEQETALQFQAPNGSGQITVTEIPEWATLTFNTYQENNNGLIADGTLTVNARRDLGVYDGTITLKWIASDASICVVDYPIRLEVVEAAQLPPPPPPPPPPEAPAPPIVSPPAKTPLGSLLSADGQIISAIPFNLNLFPSHITVTADQKTGRYNGNMEIGLQVKPGPVQNWNHDVVENVSLRALNQGGVLFYTRFGQNQPPKTSLLEATILPSFWDLKVKYVHTLTSQISLTNNSNQDVVYRVFLGTVQNLGYTQLDFKSNKDKVLIKSGTTELVNIAISVQAKAEGSERLQITLIPEKMGFETLNLTQNFEYSEKAVSIQNYQIVASQTLTYQIDAPVSTQLYTVNGPGGPEFWEVDNPESLLEMGIRLSPEGRLTSNAIIGPARSKSYVFTVIGQNSQRKKFYASKIVNVVLVN